MKRSFAMLVGLAVAVIGCAPSAGGPGTLTPGATTSGAPAAAQGTATLGTVLTADLRSTEEVPPVTGAEASCSGTVTVTFDRVANAATFDIDVRACPAGALPSVAHIHTGAAGVNGQVRIDTGLAAGQLTLNGGTGTISKTVTAAPALVADIVANPANFYFNVHTQVNPGGVVRGQLKRR